jgi:hypothetical protein
MAWSALVVPIVVLMLALHALAPEQTSGIMEHESDNHISRP